jgi:hypothetical protein
MTKTFRHYLAESVHTYNYKIKIAGQLPKNFVDMFCYNLQKFDPVKIGDAKSTPIQKDPYGFAGLKNEPITIIDVEFRYPATEPMIKQVARLLNYDENKVRMIQSKFDDSINAEMSGYEEEESHSPLLLHTELEEMPGAKDAAKAYGDSYLSSIKQQHEEANDQVKFEVAGGKTKDAFDPFKPTQTVDNKSPMTNIFRGPKPATGATIGKGKGK